MKDCLSVHGWSCWEASSFSSPSTSLLCLNNLSLIPPLLFFPPLPPSFLFSSFLSFSPPPSLVLLYPFPPLPDSLLSLIPPLLCQPQYFSLFSFIFFFSLLNSASLLLYSCLLLCPAFHLLCWPYLTWFFLTDTYFWWWQQQFSGGVFWLAVVFPWTSSLQTKKNITSLQHLFLSE